MFATYPGADGATTGRNAQRQDDPADEAQSLVAGHLARFTARITTDYDGGKMNGFDLSLFIHSTQESRNVSVSVRGSQRNPAVLDDGAAVRAARSHVSNPRQRQLHGASGSDRRRHRQSIPKTASSIRRPVRRGAATRQRARGRRSSRPASKSCSGKGPFPCWNYPSGTMRDRARCQRRFVALLRSAA